MVIQSLCMCVCDRCGQQFGRASLLIHIPNCLDLYLKHEALKPKDQRRQPPDRPTELDDELPTDFDEIQAFNARMNAVFSTNVLITCEWCGRHFRFVPGD